MKSRDLANVFNNEDETKNDANRCWRLRPRGVLPVDQLSARRNRRENPRDYKLDVFHRRRTLRTTLILSK
jgi:hypothetical protein